MKEYKNYILLVDYYRRPSRQRNTAGRYRVGAKNEKEAISLLREKIGFGSIQVYYECKADDMYAGYKEVFQEKPDLSVSGVQYNLVEPHNATANRKSYNSKVIKRIKY